MVRGEMSIHNAGQTCRANTPKVWSLAPDSPRQDLALLPSNYSLWG